MRYILILFLLFLAGCVTIEPVGYAELDTNLLEIAAGDTFQVRPFAKLYNTELRENWARDMNDPKYSLESKDKIARKAEENIEEAITDLLTGLGLKRVDDNPKFEVIYTLNSRYRREFNITRSFIMYRIHIVERESERTVFDRTGRYLTNERPDDRTIRMLTEDIFEPALDDVE